jgi:hypothetical protein
MPPQVKKSGLMAKYGANLDKVVKAHGADETTYGIQPLPPGINNGVAQLVECKFDVYKTGKNQGEYYFRAAGVVVEPREVNHNGQRVVVVGQQTSVMIPVCNTTSQAGKVTTQEEYVERILNEMRKLGADTSGATGADLEALAAALKEARPHFKFSTSLRKAMTPGQADGVWENWHGTKGLEDYSPPDDSGAVVDETGPATGGGGDEGGSGVEYSDQEDLDGLAKRADKGEDAAIDRLTELANAAGLTDEDISAEQNWVAVVARMGDGAAASDGEPRAEPEEEWEPGKDEVYKYQLKGKDGQPLKDARKKVVKPVEVEVTAVNKAKKTVDLKNLGDGKTTYKGVAWDDLIAE